MFWAFWEWAFALLVRRRLLYALAWLLRRLCSNQ
jgi:hypothetical protein